MSTVSGRASKASRTCPVRFFVCPFIIACSFLTKQCTLPPCLRARLHALLPGGRSACKRASPPGRSPWILPLACRPSSKDTPGTRDRAGLSCGHRTRPLSQLIVPERSSVCVSTCHKFVEKSLIAVQRQPRLASQIPLWLHLWRG